MIGSLYLIIDNKKVKKTAFVTSACLLPGLVLLPVNILKDGHIKLFILFSIISISISIYFYFYKKGISDTKVKIGDDILYVADLSIQLSSIDFNNSVILKEKIRIHLLNTPKRSPIKINIKHFTNESIEEMLKVIREFSSKNSLGETTF